MIGKKVIESLWENGLVWESYIQSENHWKAIKGYHKSKGYLAGESKGHQLVLPDYLMDGNRVRKFGANFKTGDIVPRGTITKGPPRKQKQKSYRDRFRHCNTTSKMCINDEIWVNMNLSGKAVKEWLDGMSDKIDYKTFHATHETIISVMSMVDPDQDQGTGQNYQKTDQD
jgi:hypothetical protein